MLWTVTRMLDPNGILKLLNQAECAPCPNHLVPQGAAGSSVARQSGAFELLDAGTRTLSTQSVSAAPGDHIVVSLTVTWADGQISRDALDETVGDAPAR